eukprot:7379019-Prymnesium_polylepis.1
MPAATFGETGGGKAGDGAAGGGAAGEGETELLFDAATYAYWPLSTTSRGCRAHDGWAGDCGTQMAYAMGRSSVNAECVPVRKVTGMNWAQGNGAHNS